MKVFICYFIKFVYAIVEIGLSEISQLIKNNGNEVGLGSSFYVQKSVLYIKFSSLYLSLKSKSVYYKSNILS